MSSYRDDLEAAQARAAAAEDEAERLRKELDRLKGARIDEVREVPIPERFKVENTANELRVSWRWWKADLVFMLFFVIAWDAFLLFWYFGPAAGRGGLLFQIFPIAHVAVGVGLTYKVLTGFLNRTVVRVRRGNLEVRHGPIPGRKNHRIASDELRQLFVAPDHALVAVLLSGKEVRLVPPLDTEAQALYLETVFEARLGIEDRRVAGEVAKV